MSVQERGSLSVALQCPDPACAEPLQFSADAIVARNSIIRCPRCGARYPVVDGIPLFVVPPATYVEKIRRDSSAALDHLVAFQSKVTPDDSYYHLAEVWSARVRAWMDDMQMASQLLDDGQAPTSMTTGTPPSSATDTFKAEYSTLEVIEEYLRSAYGVYLRPPTGNREGFYATVLSAGKTLPRDAVILDIGCGVGRTVLDYSLLCPEGIVVGLDYVYGMLNLARQVVSEDTPVSVLLKEEMRQHEIRALQGFGRSNATFVAADAQRLPFADATFDCILGNYVYSILDDYQSALREAIRLIKPGGMLIVTNGYSWEDLREPERRHNPDDMNAALRAAGMQIERDFDFANVNTANPRLTFQRATRLTVGRKDA